MNRARNALQRARGIAKTTAGRITGRRRTMMQGRVERAKADVKDDLLDAKKSVRRPRRS
jgi:uncharacterized protein YjbJ (UPF0337 family)